MVKGTTRQVVVVKGTASTPFDQAIFLVRDSVVSGGGVTEEALLREARNICRSAQRNTLRQGPFWSAIGAASVGLIWLVSSLIF